MYDRAQDIKKLVDGASKIVIIQADNPDADSLGSALALEHILGDLGKEPFLYCGVDMPGYLRYVAGWDRVSKELPAQFDLSFIVDASTMTLLERLVDNGYQSRLSVKPCVVLDHHAIVDHEVPFASVTINDPSRASAGELIYFLAKQLEWPLSVETQGFLMNSILGDTQGLTNQLAKAETYRVMAEFVDSGVDRPALEELRREYGRMPQAIFRYKGELIKRAEFSADDRVAHVTIPQAEINEFSPLYNPAPLIQGDMLQTTGVGVAIVFKLYGDGKITAAIRCNSGNPIAGQLAEHFGGGGHAFASGFKITDGRGFDDVKAECLRLAAELLDKLKTDEQHETV
ncbi:MAG TPA: DHH family phosphoesterase [Candidatus Dormibacteraeota bacterium]|nr:DHH family phosphoesterase [Candidatus Dormibacteraeota bacterium]